VNANFKVIFKGGMYRSKEQIINISKGIKGKGWFSVSYGFIQQG
jgi:hypothetical protein